MSRDIAVNNVRSDVVSRILDSFGADNIDGAKISEYFNTICKEVFRESIFENDTRCDGRTLDQLRNITCQVTIVQ